MVTGVFFLFIEISYMLLLSCPIKYFFKQQILSVKHWDWYIGYIKTLMIFSFLKRKTRQEISLLKINEFESIL